MSLLHYVILAILIWLAIATHVFLRERKSFLASPALYKGPDPIKYWWLYYLSPILLPIALPIGIYNSWKSHRNWAREFKKTGALFWLHFAPKLRKSPRLSALLGDAVKIGSNTDPIGYALRWLLDVELRGATGVRVSEYTAIFQWQKKYYVIHFFGADPLFIHSVDVLVSINCASIYSLSDVVESYCERHDCGGYARQYYS